MTTFENIVEKIMEDTHWVRKAVIGGVLSFIPIVNFFALGYMYRYARQIEKTKSLKLPEWDQWKELFEDGVHFFIVLIFYCLIPYLAALLLETFLSRVTMELLGWVPLAIVFLMSPTFVIIVLHALKGERDWDALFDIKNHCLNYRRYWKALIVPTLAFIGLLVITFPLFGFSFFLGFVPFVAYSVLVFISRETSE